MWRFLLALPLLLLVAVPAPAVDKKDINRAIDAGVAALKKMQQAGGAWNHNDIGATALAGVTLLECGCKASDKSVQAAAEAVRKAIVNSTHTYSISLAILFLDRLNEKSDTPLIESLVLRLMGGQQTNGAWGYKLPAMTDAELKRIRGESGTRVLKGSRDLSKLPAKGKRKESDLPKEVQDRIKKLNQPNAAPEVKVGGTDNSNTQFATLALWVGRRYGIPVSNALKRNALRFVLTQKRDGGWTYTSGDNAAGGVPGVGIVDASSSTAAMTCAGLLGLAAWHGDEAKAALSRNPKAGPRDISNDKSIKAGLIALSTAVGNPVGARGLIPPAAGKAFYFLWSLERVCVALNLQTLAKKDWYGWGCEILIANQRRDGAWAGDYATSGADTCFALLFLKRSNLAGDLSGSLKALKGAGVKRLKAGGIGGGGLKNDKVLKPAGIGDKKPITGKKDPPESKNPGKPLSPAAKLGAELVKAKGERRGEIIKKLRDTKGVAYTEALVEVIPKLDLLTRNKARTALAERLARLKAGSLRQYFKDEDGEIRRAAALASAAKEDKTFIPDLITLLRDSEALVERTAYAALKELSGKDFGPKAGAGAADRKKAIAAWEGWWKKK